MTFHGQHRPIESYFLALEEAGLLVAALREPRVPDRVVKSDRGRRWQRAGRGSFEVMDDVPSELAAHVMALKAKMLTHPDVTAIDPED
jgi:hypothetical protein